MVRVACACGKTVSFTTDEPFEFCPFCSRSFTQQRIDTEEIAKQTKLAKQSPSLYPWTVLYATVSYWVSLQLGKVVSDMKLQELLILGWVASVLAFAFLADYVIKRRLRKKYPHAQL